jgi:hypothetical protein
MEKKIKGQRTREEFAQQYGANYQEHAVIKYGKSTYNYWMQHDDGSWTNYDCRTRDMGNEKDTNF